MTALVLVFQIASAVALILFILLHAHLPPEMIYERELLICRL